VTTSTRPTLHLEQCPLKIAGLIDVELIPVYRADL
jgi:hypothetical protein